MSEFMDEAKKLAGEHSDQVDQGLDQAEQLAEQKTGGAGGCRQDGALD